MSNDENLDPDNPVVEPPVTDDVPERSANLLGKT